MLVCLQVKEVHMQSDKMASLVCQPLPFHVTAKSAIVQ